ncbi:alpha/beta-hydrolase [Trametes elegans]|nr:alpha/beta-hydrolase [Trametes elegans]
MDKVSRFVSRLRRKQSRPPQPSVNVSAAATIVETIPPAPAALISEEMRAWADRAGVDLGPVDGVWWYVGGTDTALAQAQQSGGLVGLHFHGGGYMLGSVKDVRSGFARVPKGFVEGQICSCVLSVEYTLARSRADGVKRSIPLQILEALSAYHHILEALNIPASRVLLIGDSAGGHLALALQRYLLESDAMPSPQGVVLLSPWCDLVADADDVRGLLGPLPTEDLNGPYFSPGLHPPPLGWPPTLVYLGAQERFAPSITTLVSRLADAGVQVAFHEAAHILPRYRHDFLIFRTVEETWPDEVRKCWARIRLWTEAISSTQRCAMHPYAHYMRDGDGAHSLVLHDESQCTARGQHREAIV